MRRTLDFRQVDVFTDAPFGGNGLIVLFVDQFHDRSVTGPTAAYLVRCALARTGEIISIRQRRIAGQPRRMFANWISAVSSC